MPNTIRSFDQLSFSGKRVIVRADLNVPLRDGVILDDSRLERSLRTILTILDGGGTVILLSHFGRPKGYDPAYSLKFLAPLLEKRTGYPVVFVPNIGDFPALQRSEHIYLLENIRFYPGEESGDPAFAQHLATLGDLYVNDAFSVCHRSHASVALLPHYLPAYGGYLLVEELSALGRLLASPARPLGAIVGGAKISTKIGLLTHLIKNVDYLIVGGGIATTFLRAAGHGVGHGSLWEPSCLEVARTILGMAQHRSVKLLLPEDVRGLNGSSVFQAPVQQIPEGGTILDVGPLSQTRFASAIGQMGTVLWNGPLGAFEREPFDQGSIALAKCIGAQTQKHLLYSVIGGGETNAVVKKAGVHGQISYASAAGGAFLAYLEGADLPGLTALQQSKE